MEKGAWSLPGSTVRSTGLLINGGPLQALVGYQGPVVDCFLGLNG